MEGPWVMLNVKFPVKARIIDLRYPNLDYMITVKDQRDWIKIKSLEESPNFRIELKMPKLLDQELEPL